MKKEHITSKGSQYNFNNFNITENNRAAFEMAKQFAENVNAKPLHIHGKTATGKTHLLYAVKNHIELHKPDVKVILTNAEVFSEKLINTIKECSSIPAFRVMYSEADVLLMDDIQLLAGKPTVQQQLILIFNSLYESGCRIMTTSSDTDIDVMLEDRLRSRLYFEDYITIKAEV
ncbi:MAG: ATP-binding protein [Ruminococcus sp.]|nr:ATP-binding protein [Ruminococcus sp.]MBR4622838.1 ATP-binding protein [Ruminococcus sp.]